MWFYSKVSIFLWDSNRFLLGIEIPVTSELSKLPSHVKIGYLNKAFPSYYSFLSSIEECFLSSQCNKTFVEIRQRATEKLFALGRSIILFFVEQQSQVLTASLNYEHFEISLDSLVQKIFYNQSQCSDFLICPPGFHKVYGNVSKGFSWKCEQCPINHFKSKYDNTTCQPCSGKFSIDNGHRTACVENGKMALQEIPLQMSNERVFVVTICSIGVLATFPNRGHIYEKENFTDCNSL